MMIEAFDVAYSRATARIVPASMPQIGAIVSGQNALTFSARASYPEVRSRTNASLTSPSLTITCSIALSSATSVSGLNCR